ncbi:A24 family peptidase [Cohnella yongneupensis]|uniref:Prepilin peptidase n=1 Tax=Cohnella yongneupensis TaxID=425006 RepID=A0ABW0R306_9BACL
MNTGAVIAVSVLLVAACWTDLRTMRIPNALNVGFACCGLLYQLIYHGYSGLVFAVVGAIAGILPLYALFLMRGMGGGDVKWFGAFGIWMGALPTLRLMLYSIVFAGAIAAILVLLRLPVLRKLGERIRWPWGLHPVSQGKGARFPFMLAVAPSFIMLLGQG